MTSRIRDAALRSAARTNVNSVFAGRGENP